MSRNHWMLSGILGVAVTGAFFAGRAVSSRSGQGAEEIAGATHEADASDHGEIRLTDAAAEGLGLRLAVAELRNLDGVTQATGIVGADETRVARIRALARGRVDAVHARLGDRVRSGQRLLSYDNPELGEAIGEYLSGLAATEKAGTEAEVSQRALERARNLVSLGAIAKAELDRREAEYRNALASVESQKAATAKFEEQLHRFGMTDEEIAKLELGSAYHREASHTMVVAPLAGVVAESPPVAGVPFNAGDPLVTIADLSTVWVQADVYQKDIAGIRRGVPVQVTTEAYPGRTFTGRVSYVSDFLDPQTRTAKVRCEVPNPEGLLKLEMFVNVRIASGETRSALMVPVEAVQRIGEETVVFVPSGEGVFRSRPVRILENGDGWAEVLDGLRAGEKVVTQGSFVLKSELRKAELGGHEH